MAVKSVNAKKILDTSLKIANQKSWQSLRLFEIAKALNIPLSEIKKYYKNKDEIADAWFHQAMKEMLSKSNDPDFAHLTIHERLHFLIIAWLTALAPYQRVTKEIIYNRLHPLHMKGKISALKSIQSTSDWLLEAIQFETTKTKHSVSALALSAVLVNTFLYWLYDYSENFEDTRRFLSKELNTLETIVYFADHWVREPISKIKNIF